MTSILNDPEIYKTLVVSTSHITSMGNDLLPQDSIFSSTHIGNPLSATPNDYGYHIYVGNYLRDVESRKEIMRSFGYSDELYYLMLVAIQKGCKYLDLDCDGTVYDDIPTFEW